MSPSDTPPPHWRADLIVTAVLLVLWFVVSFGVAFFARQLSFSFFGWPFSFWMGAQGALFIYVLIVWFYAYYMNRLERRQEEGVTGQDTSPADGPAA